VGKALPYNDTNAIRARLAQSSPVFARVGDVARAGCSDTAGPTGGAFNDAPFVLPIPVYHQADVISRASDTMATCAAVYGPQPALAAE
jgi:NADH-quinone oxidoreductase subunit G